MANRQRPTITKRERERGKQQRRQQKEARRQEAKARRAERPSRQDGEDPDLIGIRPGPQPPADWQNES